MSKAYKNELPHLARERESRCYMLSKTMPRPNSAEAAIQFYNRGGGGFRLHTPPNLVLELNSKKRKKEHKKGSNKKKRASSKRHGDHASSKGSEKKVSIVETAKSVEGLTKKNELSHLSERTKGTEEITRLTKGVALSSKKAAYTPSVPSKNETKPSVVVP